MPACIHCTPLPTPSECIGPCRSHSRHTTRRFTDAVLSDSHRRPLPRQSHSGIPAHTEAHQSCRRNREESAHPRASVWCLRSAEFNRPWISHLPMDGTLLRTRKSPQCQATDNSHDAITFRHTYRKTLWGTSCQLVRHPHAHANYPECPAKAPRAPPMDQGSMRAGVSENRRGDQHSRESLRRLPPVVRRGHHHLQSVSDSRQEALFALLVTEYSCGCSGRPARNAGCRSPSLRGITGVSLLPELPRLGV
mmetsp:Transcript_4936/g.7373  ORF Transcript_4936/g.7373 Transcript_4936/m.7373 type:complete len:250 (+) Transcript_4936:211-960(+)